MDDAELVRQVLQGNRSAYGRLVERYTAHLAAVCRARVRRREVVEDLVQEAFVRGLDQLSSLREPERFGYWLSAIARNLCNDWLGDPYRKHLPLEDAAPTATPATADEVADEEERAGRFAALKKCVDRLLVELREVVEMYYSSGDRVTYEDLANRLGVTFSTVNKRLTQARKLLGACLGKKEAITSLLA
jgi:RNA polymerase sigma-70 factor (ECF subfamily)